MVLSPDPGADMHSTVSNQTFFWRAAPTSLALLGDLLKDECLAPAYVALAEI